MAKGMERHIVCTLIICLTQKIINVSIQMVADAHNGCDFDGNWYARIIFCWWFIKNNLPAAKWEFDIVVDDLGHDADVSDQFWFKNKI